jgi:peptidoglycan lytic transglycosylase F
MVLVAVLGLGACENRGPSLETLRAAGELRVALVSVPHTYYLEPEGILGFDYELLRDFSRNLGVRLAVTMVDNRAQAKAMVARRRVHLAAGLIPVTPDNAPRIRYGPSYSMLQGQVIYLSGNPRPRDTDDLIGATIETPAGGLGNAELSRLAPTHRDLHWTTPTETSIEQLLTRVNSGAIDYAIVPSTDFMVLRLKYPRLEIGFGLGQLYATAWALSARSQTSIDRAVVDFFIQSEGDGLRESLWERYYGHYGRFDFVDARAFLRAYDERFPPLRDYFFDAGAAVGIDWRLLAALSYQESHWDPDARSPTGVRGLMMLTRRTAEDLRVTRLDPRQAVDGGARYLADLHRRLPASVDGDDRLWFALAAYNVGLGHLEDARVLTEQRGGNPNVWRDLRRYLPLLSKKSVADTTRHGKARGGETVHFVTGIRRYFDVIRQLERRPVGAGDGRDGSEIRVMGIL